MCHVLNFSALMSFITDLIVYTLYLVISGTKLQWNFPFWSLFISCYIYLINIAKYCLESLMYDHNAFWLASIVSLNTALYHAAKVNCVFIFYCELVFRSQCIMCSTLLH